MSRVERLMRENGLRARTTRRFRSTTDSRHSARIAPNLLDRKFSASKPNQVWASDVTYFWSREGWVYLGVTIDLYSRTVVGWKMGDRLDASLSTDAISMAITQRRPRRGLIHHSDRGKEFSCYAFRRLPTEREIVQSISRKGDCWDNAVVESFFKSLKLELGYAVYKTREELKQAVFEWIEVHYNRQRLHSTLGYLAPLVYEKLTS